MNQFLITCFRSGQPQALSNVPVNAPSIIYVSRGTKRLIWREQTINVEKEHLLVVPPRQSLSFVNLPEQGKYTAWQFCFPFRLPTYISQHLIEAFHSTNDTSELQHHSGSSPLLHVNDDLMMAIKSAIAAKEGDRAESLQLHYMYGILVALAQSYDISSMFLPHDESILERVIQILSWSPAQEWRAEDVASTLAMSESTFRRKLKEQNASFRDLLIEVRLSHGLNLLQLRHLDLYDVAAMCGYISYDRFARQFKKRFSLSPNEYRKTCL